MSWIQPFAGWRYHPGQVALADVMALPVAQLSDSERATLYARHLRNCIRLTAALDSETAAAEAPGHARVWRADETLYHDHPAFYLLEQEWTCATRGVRLTRRGVLAQVVLAPIGEQQVCALEEASVTEEREEEYRRLRVCGGAVEPLPLLLQESEHLAGILQDRIDWEPVAEAQTDDGVTQRLWVLDKPELLEELGQAASQSSILIPAGRARWEATLANRNHVREALSAAGQQPPELGYLSSDTVLAACFPLATCGLSDEQLERLAGQEGEEEAPEVEPSDEAPVISEPSVAALPPLTVAEIEDSLPAVPSGLVFQFYI